MDVFEAIRNRRSIGRVKPDPIEKETITKLLEAATWAPNHYNTEPWKFFVLTEEGRRPLGRTLAEIAKETMEDPTCEENEKKLKKVEEKAFRAPVIITVAATPSDNPKALPIEEIGAVNAAIQNLLLAAHALGLGAIWRTGKPCYHSKMKELFGLTDKQEVLGFIYLGYPDIPQRQSKRIPFKEKTVWVQSDRRYN
ncbi:nitroreductase [Bacillus pakistanensis]|uniref:Putative NAD(P)H nitroreductase n=1 Tax=Rossellomorea pakistanensis TaxID=992288 RepID=A0ABS2NDI4_9BACI|nr:nitroreductase [Bacillus pakistanensis]MBM7585912.1 nitroreductase [Bacillus pakistanensis]